MSNEANDKGWILHSLAQARRFGPMSEDDLRGYFRAGMVKSVDRLTAPGDHAMRPAAEVATMLGVPVPPGPPPPQLEQSPTPLPSMATSVARETSEERAAKAAAAMNIDIAALMASNAPTERRAGWVMPVIVVVAMVFALLIGLKALRRMEVPAAQAPVAADAMPAERTIDPASPGPVPATVEAPPPAPAANAAGADDPTFDTREIKAQELQDARNWSALAVFARQWSQARPDLTQPLIYLGVAYSGLGEYKLAVEPLERAHGRAPADVQTRSMLADAYLQSQRWTEATQAYKELVNFKPNDARLWNNYGAALNASGQQVQAIAAVETAVRLDPTFKQAWTNLGNLYQATGDTPRATAAFANAR